MSIRIFKSKLIRQQLTQQELDDLVADFLSYKKEGVLPDIFGRDAFYNDDYTYPLVKKRACSSHSFSQCGLRISYFLRQFKRTSDQAHLVYCQGSIDSDTYLLIFYFEARSA